MSGINQGSFERPHIVLRENRTVDHVEESEPDFLLECIPSSVKAENLP